MLISWTVEEHSNDCKEIYGRADFTINLLRSRMDSKTGTKEFDPDESIKVMEGIERDLPGIQTAVDVCASGPIQMISVRPDGKMDDILTSRLLTLEEWPDPKINCGADDLKPFDGTAFGQFAVHLIRYVMASTMWWKEHESRA
jgi:hypothetical protein